MPTLLVVDLLAEREAFGEHGTAEIVRHFPGFEVLLWAPHTDEPREYSFGERIESPVEHDVLFITGSRRNVSMWEPWMDEVAELIRTNEAPIYGICFGHQIICSVLGGKVIREEEGSHFIAPVHYIDGRVVDQLFTHQDHVIDAGEMEIIASSEHCEIVACKHPTRDISTVQFHPESVQSVLEHSLLCGDMTAEERMDFGEGSQTLDVAQSLFI